LYYLKELISVTELKEYDDDNIKTKQVNHFDFEQASTCQKTTDSRISYHSTDIPSQKHHSQPILNPYNTPSLKVHVYSHSSTLPLYLLHGPLFFHVASFVP